MAVSRKRLELAAVKEYLDEHYTEKIALDDLSEHFFINKFYLSKIFRETYGTTVNNYLISKRITRAPDISLPGRLQMRGMAYLPPDESGRH